jgi:hypothetical protein
MTTRIRLQQQGNRVENWITRIVAALCAAGSTALFWTLGVFVVVPWREGRMLALDRFELQVIGVPLILGVAVAWGALHLFAIADRREKPKTYAMICAVLIIISIAAVIGGVLWTQARIT